ncbi:MAG TPA: peptidylprolyl isomerase [Candidatus Eremiobacteraceae bacterium]|nr:peptidylprolyl isomerase [Candidatus Eremiobacteraceae bacterium]
MFSKFAMVAVLAAGVVATAGCAGSKPVITVNGTAISKSDFDNKLEGNTRASQQVLQQMADKVLIDQYAKANNITASDTDIDAALAKIEANFPAGQFETVLKQQGLSMADARDIVREQVLLKNAVDKDIKVDQTQIDAYLKTNKVSMNSPAQVRVRHILVKTQAEANSIEKQLKAGANFAALAAKYSVDPSTKDKGGELPIFGPGQMVASFQAAAFKLKVGQISAPVQSPFGWHVIQSEQIIPNTRATIVSAIQAQQEPNATTTLITNLRSQAKIDYNDQRFVGLFPSPPPLPPATAVSPAPAPTH